MPNKRTPLSRSPRHTTAHPSRRSQADAPAPAYVRERDLPRLVALWPSQLTVITAADHMRLLAILRRALRVERQRGLAGHWAYDLARHAHLLRAYRAETARYLAARSESGCGEGNIAK